MTVRSAGPALIGLLCLGAAGCMTTPPEQDPVQIKLNDLDTRLARIERVVANQSLLELANELEALRNDVRSLHNDADQLTHNLETGRKQQRDFYADLDARLKNLEGRGAGTGQGAGSAGTPGQSYVGAPPGSVAAGAGTAAASAGATPGGAASTATPGSGAAASSATGLPVPDGSDRANYQAAFALLKDSQYDKAITAFQHFLIAFPDSSLADNAQYWLGEAYYVNKSFPEALKAFQRVADKYPQSRKLPDALLKVGFCRYELKQWDAAKDVLADVATKYSDAPAGRLAAQRLEKIATEKH